MPKTRRQLDTEVLGELLSAVNFDRKDKMLKLLNPSTVSSDDAKNIVVEVELYIALLVVIYLLDQKRYDDVKDLADGLIIKIGHNVGQRKSLDPLNAKIYYYHRYSQSILLRFFYPISPYSSISTYIF